MKTYIITEKEIKLRTQEKARCLARYLSERNNKKYFVYLCIPFSEIFNKEERIFSDGEEMKYQNFNV